MDSKADHNLHTTLTTAYPQFRKHGTYPLLPHYDYSYGSPFLHSYIKYLEKVVDFDAPRIQAGGVLGNGFRAHSPYHF